MTWWTMPGDISSLSRPVLPCKNDYFWKLELVRAMSVLVLQYSCNFSAVGCSQVEQSVVPNFLEKFMFYE